MFDADVEGQIVFEATAAAPRRNPGFETERGVPLSLDQASDAPDAAQGCERCEIGFDSSALFQRRVRDDPAEPRVGVRHFLNESGLLQVETGVDRHFGEDDLVDDDRRAGFVEILEQICPVDLRHACEPRVAQSRDVIEVYVAIDDRKSGHGFFSHSSQRPTRASSDQPLERKRPTLGMTNSSPPRVRRPASQA